jgi:hypothetical protein
MYKSKYLKLLIFILAWEPAALKLHWFAESWRRAPIDRLDSIFILAAVVIGIVFFNDFKKEASTLDYSGIIPLILSAAGILGAIYLRINLIYMIFALLFCASMAWLLWGWRVFARILPLCLMLMLALPASTYWCGEMLQRFAGINPACGIGVKFIAAILLITFELYLETFTKTMPSKSKFFYYAGILFWLLSLLFFFEKPSHGVPLKMNITIEPAGKWLGETVEPDPVEKAFYEGQPMQRFIHYSEAYPPISSSVINISGNVHKLHPFGLCLSSGNPEIISSRHVELNTGAGAAVANRIEVMKKNRHFIYYVWYNSPKRSSDSFALFRSLYAWDAKWTMYQISTPVEYGNPQEADQRIRNFIKIYSAIEAKPAIQE